MLTMIKKLFCQIEQYVRSGVTASHSDKPSKPVTLFVSFSDTLQRAQTHTFNATSFRDCWKAAIEKTCQEAARTNTVIKWLRVDWPEADQKLTWSELQAELKNTKRNYFRFGIALDPHYRHAFLETELNANAMLYGGADVDFAVVNTKNFLRYASKRFGISEIALKPDDEVSIFSTKAVFIESGENVAHLINGCGRSAGRRTIPQMFEADVASLIDNGSRFLSTQVETSGRFIYGWHPCFGRRINSYNALRHASTLYSMIEAWEVTRNEALKEAIDRGLKYLTDQLIQSVSHPDGEMAFLIDENSEIKLGGNAVCLLALVKYCEATSTDQYLPLLEKLARGILLMQDPATGKFVHVLNFPSLTVKQPFRIIYYDGEAAFGLMRLYSLTGEERWLNAVERAFEHFMAVDHWKAHDHWLSYAVNEITRYRPKREYYEFGIKNFVDYLDFVENRITTFPTLLELMMAAQQMIARLNDDLEFKKLLQLVDLEKFNRALESRAHYLLNGHFWPELAMFFQQPSIINGSFFIRHHAFRVRIDDVEHYLSGLVAYLKYKKKQPMSVPQL